MAKTKEIVIGGKTFTINKMNVANYMKHSELYTRMIRESKLSPENVTDSASIINTLLDSLARLLEIGGGSDVAMEIVFTMMHNDEFGDDYESKKAFLQANMFDEEISEVQTFFFENRLMNELAKRLQVVKPIISAVKEILPPDLKKSLAGIPSAIQAFCVNSSKREPEKVK